MSKPRDIPTICFAQSLEGRNPKVVFGIPLPKGQDPYPQTVQALRDSIPLVEDAGFEHGFTYTSGNPYISGARAEITRKALDAKADIIVYIDYDVSWKPQDMVTLLQAEGEVVGGTYRCKTDNEGDYMGAIYTHHRAGGLICPCGQAQCRDNTPLCREDGCIKARTLPAGFLKVTTAGIDRFMRAYPELCYGPQFALSVDLFHHGAYEGIWWGEDYAFCRNFGACGGECWLIPNLDLTHWQRFEDKSTGKVSYKSYPGNYHEFLLRCPGGSKHELSQVAV